MNPVEELVRRFQDLVSQVPEIAQPLIVALAGAVPFIEGEVAAIIGVVGGINPILAAGAGAVGNFLCVVLVVLLVSRARTAVSGRRTARAEATVRTPATVGSGTGEYTPVTDENGTSGQAPPAPAVPAVKPESKGRQRFDRWLVRFGVPGASILGPLAIPTQFTAAILTAGGTPRRWTLLWQAIAIALWTTISTVSVWLALQVVSAI